MTFWIWLAFLEREPVCYGTLSLLWIFCKLLADTEDLEKWFGSILFQ
ncbi:MAG TPA: hypothetical protein H9667_03780 [Firmicutes bacterium]|nr:hypothetical protein [Bacillota bacterium]